MKLADFNIRVLRPEDVIGLKVQAMVNDAARRNKELADIEAILERHAGKLHWDDLREYFALFELDGEYERLQGRYGNAD